MAYNIVGNGYNYLGVTAVTPPNLQINPNAPTINNMNANIGDFWLQKDTTNLWFLTSLENQQAIWTPVGGGGGGTITAVNGGDNINVTTVAGVATVNLNTSISQPNTNSSGTEGLYSLGGNRFLHNKGLFCTYLGNDSGNLSNGGSSNVGIGQNSLNSISGSYNVAVGAYSAASLTSGSRSIIIGAFAGASLTTQDRNIAIGYNAINYASNFLAEDNVAIGSNVLEQASNPSATIAIGYGCLKRASTSSGNTCVGHSVADSLQTGNNNIILGSISGQNLASNESNNIIISNFGEIDDQNTIRIGTEGSGSRQQNTTYIAGIYNNSVDGGTQQTVIIDSTGKLGSMVGGGGGGISAVNGGDNITVNTVGTVATVNLNKSIAQPITNAAGTEGLYSLGGLPFLHNYGTNNTFIGSNAGNLTLIGGGSDNVAVGNLAGNALSSGFNNVFIGPEAGSSNTSGETNIFVGLQSGLLNTSGTGNIAIGILALSGAATAQNNLILGNASGTNYTGSESDNILISSEGVTGDNNVLRIGDSGTGNYQIDSAYLAGTYARTVDGGTQQFVVIDSVGKLGSVIGGGGGGDVNTLTGDTGPAVTSTGNNIDINGGLNINTSGAASTLTLNLNTSILQPVTNGSGTQGIYALGSTDFVTDRFLHNAGSESNIFLGRQSGNLTNTSTNTVSIGFGSATNITTGQDNVLIGYRSGYSLTSQSDNVFIGLRSGSTISDLSSTQNTLMGSDTLINATLGLATTTSGYRSLYNASSSTANTCLGALTGFQLLTGNYNLLLGAGTGAAFTSNESNNVILCNAGTPSDSNTIRIGTEGSGNLQQNKTYVAGIYNQSIGSTAGVVMIDSNTKLGSSNGSNGQVLIGGGTKPAWANITSTDGSITITNGVNSIDLSSDGGGGTISGTYSTTIVGYAGYTYSPDIVQIPVDAVLHINFSVIGAGKYTSGVNNGKSVGMIQESTYGAIRQDGGSSVFVFAGVDELKSIYRQNFTTFGTTTIVIDMVEGSDPSYVRFRFNANQNTSGNLTVGFTINYSYFITNSPV